MPSIGPGPRGLNGTATMLALWLGLLPSCLWAGPTPQAAVSYRLYTAEEGIHRVSFEALKTAASDQQSWPSAQLALSHRGSPVAIWIDDHGDGVFGPGDSFEFAAEKLLGPHGGSHDYSPTNVYWLSLGAPSRARLATGARHGAGDRPRRSLARTQHLEHDRLMVRIAAKDLAGVAEPELWFWSKLTHIDKEPLEILVDLRDLDREAERSIEVRASFRALSSHHGPGDGLDHEVVLAANGAEQERYRWNGKSVFTSSFRPLAASVGSGGTLSLTLRVPKRRPPGERHPIVDVAMLNWVEVRYPSNGRIGSEQMRLELEPGPAEGAVELAATTGERLIVLGARHRFSIEPGEASTLAAEDETRLWVAPESSVFGPAQVVLAAPSDLRSPRQADYLLIAHPSLRAAAEPLADFHRSSGLTVESIDVDDIYDEFNHGIPHPRAIKDFLRHTYRRWEAPQPRYVLLVGDASWDVKNAQADDANYANWSDRFKLRGRSFGDKPAQEYPAGGRPGERNLIPAWSIHYEQGHAASDNGFVTLEGDDLAPEMAIGRLPVTQPAEVTAIVAKILAYAGRPPIGEWRRRVLWITNEDPGYQLLTARLADDLERRGFAALEIYPQPSEPDNAEHQQTLLRALADGQLLVIFNGHGGRYMWRTGPPDLEKQHDLFTLDHLDLLAESERLPIVLSLTCHSGPFDHPSADSIAEKFLRLDKKGAVAVISASWRNNPGMAFSRFLAEEVTGGARLGDAFRAAKERYQRLAQVELYNLFGDPALAIATPGATLEIVPATGDRRYDVRLPWREFAGHLAIRWLDANNGLAAHEVIDSSSNRLTVTAPEGAIASVSIYAWDPAAHRDALGSARLSPATGARAAGASVAPDRPE